MDRVRGMSGWGIAAALVCGVAQARLDAQEAFGTGPQVTIVPASQFTGKISSTQPDLVHVGNGYFGDQTAGSSRYYAPLLLPAGAVITDITCFVKDPNTTDDIAIGLHRYVHDVFSNLPAGYTEAYLTSQGASGYQRPSSGPLNHTVRYRDGNAYTVYFLFADVATDTWLRECRITWHRSLSPAPAAATFADVPTNYTYFRAIEGLAAAGITGGCGNGNFCPNQGLTRGEFAAFLARALGLHWPE